MDLKSTYWLEGVQGANRDIPSTVLCLIDRNSNSGYQVKLAGNFTTDRKEIFSQSKQVLFPTFSLKTSRRTERELDSDTRRIVPLHHICLHLLPIPQAAASNLACFRPQPLPERFGPNDEQISNLGQYVQALIELLIQLPAPEQLVVFANVFCNHKSTGGADLEFAEVFKQKMSYAERNLGEECRQ